MENRDYAKRATVPLFEYEEMVKLAETTNRSNTDEMPPQTVTVPQTSSSSDLEYAVDDVPPWQLCLLLGFQHYLTMLGGMVAAPLIVASVMCIGEDWVATSELMSTMFFVSGVVTLLQCTVGCRLPIVQGATFTFLLPAMALFKLDKWRCTDSVAALDGNTSYTSLLTINATLVSANASSTVDIGWQARMREVQGAIMLASVLEVVIGATGLVGVLLRFIGPLTIAPVITLVGLPLFPVAANYCKSNWPVAFLMMILIALFSQYLRDVDVPIFSRRGGKCRRVGVPLFRIFPVVLAIAISWLVCGILTVTDAVPNDPTHWAYKTRTDTKATVLLSAQWFRVPYPFQWGMPTFSVPGVVGMLSAVLAGMVESIGDYYACARLCGAPIPGKQVVNRGIFVEGIGCVLVGMFGTGTGLTSYSENIGAIGITRVGSRRVMISGGGIMIVMGLMGKFAALFVTIPEPVIGGMFVVLFGVISAVGVSNLQFVDLNSSRNLFVFGVSVMLGLTIPDWMHRHPNAIDTGVPLIDQTITVLAMTHMFVGGSIAMILDNTMPGTAAERGIAVWNIDSNNDDCNSSCDVTRPSTSTYDLPYVMPAIRRIRWLRFVPICPTFTGFVWQREFNVNDMTHGIKASSERAIKTVSYDGSQSDYVASIIVT